MAFPFSFKEELMSLDSSELPANIDEAIRSFFDSDDFDSSFADSDSLGSSCASPSQSSPESLSPANSPGALDGFVFPGLEDLQGAGAKKPKTKRSRKGQTEEERLRRKGESKIKRNERERRRVKRLAEGFRKLRKAVPTCGGEDNKKLSKLDTLRFALDYIQDLACLLQEHDATRPQGEVFAQASYDVEHTQAAKKGIKPEEVVSNTFALLSFHC